jgi:hypothetical protein
MFFRVFLVIWKTSLTLTFILLWIVTLYSLVKITNFSEEYAASIMEVTGCSKTLVTFEKPTHRIPGDSDLHIHRRENYRSHIAEFHFQLLETQICYEEQQGFRRRCFCTDAIFYRKTRHRGSIRLQLTSLLFIDLEKSFHHLELKKMLEDSILIAESEMNLQRILHHFILSRHK